jgi:hypothetical protein
MKTAVIYSGQARTFKKCWPTQYWHVLRKLENPHFFCSVADDEKAGDMELLCERFKHVQIARVKQPQLPEPDAKFAAFAPYALSTSIQGVLRQLWAINHAWEFASANTSTSLDGFDVVVRIRPDLWFHECIIERMPKPNEALTPFWGNYGGINDRFALLGNSCAAFSYFTAYSRLDDILKAGCPLHPESIIGYATTFGGNVVTRTLAAEFSTIRLNGEQLWPVILPTDTMRLLSSLRQ